MRDIKKIIVHCSYTMPHQDIGLEEIRRWHVEDRGWRDVGYHFIIRRNGQIEKGRPVEMTGAHARGHNKDSIGVCLVGGMSDDGKPDFNYTGSQMDRLWVTLDELIETYHVPKVIGHRDVSDKPCPCFDVKAWYYR